MITRNTAFVASLAAALTLFGTGVQAQTPPPAPPMAATPGAMPMSPTPGAMPMGGTPAPSATLNDTDKLFMLRAAQGDMGEIMSSQMALKKSRNADVKAVAQRLVTDHGASLQEGMGLGVLLGLPAPKDPGLMNEAYAAQLRSASGKDFDKIYMAGQVEAHENTIALYGMELSQGQDPQVKAFAMKYLPGIESHTAQIYQVAMAVNAPDSNLRPATPPMVSGVAPASMSGMSSGMNGTSPGAGGSGGMTGGASTGTGGSGTTTGATAPGQ